MSFYDYNFELYSNLSLKNKSDESWHDGKIRVNEFIILEVLVAFFAVSGNALVLTVFCKDKRLRIKPNLYIISLACADLCVGICGIPLAILLVNFFNYFE